jgi:NAD(P)H-dependent FMN reductase
VTVRPRGPGRRPLKPSRFVACDGGDRGVKAVPLRTLVLYGSYRSDRKGIRLARHICEELWSRGDMAELIDAKAIGLPIMDRMYKKYRPGEAPTHMEALAAKIRQADAFVFVVGEYNWGVQPGLKNLTDHFLRNGFGGPPPSRATPRAALPASALRSPGAAPFPKWA